MGFSIDKIKNAKKELLKDIKTQMWNYQKK